MRITFSLFAILVISMWLALISTGFESIQGWVSFYCVTILGVGLLFGGWWVIRSDPAVRFNEKHEQQSTITEPQIKEKESVLLPNWLGYLLIGAALLRLGAGVLWFISLPDLGYGSDVENSGYVMADAFNRDKAAWELAQSEKPLLAAFDAYDISDQYGGMLFGSAMVYRFLGGETHQPLQIVVLTAAISSLAVLFTWVFAFRTWDIAVAGAAAWIVGIFPDAVLLGSSQMREAILMGLTVMGFYGLARVWQDRSITGLIWMAAPILIAFPLSPLFGVMMVGMLGVFALFLGGGSWLKNWQMWVVLIGLVLLGFMVVSIFGDQILPGGAPDPIRLLQRWLEQAGRWQSYYAEHASGWMQKIFRSTPKWTHSWLLLFYGIARPFLPAALFDSAAPIWQAIAIWRSSGWTFLLPFLIAAPVIGWQRDGWRSRVVGLSILVWCVILMSSYRGGGDHWDNPRYRVIWIGLQASVASWVWIYHRRNKTPWLRRILIVLGLILIWWIPWYMRRVATIFWPIQNVFLTLGLGIMSALLYLIIDLWFERKWIAQKGRQTKNR